MKVTTTALDGVIVIEPAVFEDERGTFSEVFSEAGFAAHGFEPPHRFVQDNESRSRRGVVRGLHFQKAPHAQAKLARVAAGAILDVALDMRAGSGTFGRWIAVEMSAENRRQLFIPRGFAHGFVAREEDTVVIYKVDAPYAPQSEDGVLWCDPALGIDWGVAPDRAIVSAKDAALPTLAEAYKF
ncbi:MAG: dTDP-4-dehydrorhamnose 3,5-epimerase [Alistipes sp.]|jgi:dTDP-4-dehydrorhamnose 3,5-epimerase|nr:dTDP-4-dehydrorhamnose 3,5-epimerase [Alistipes sp.]